MFFIIALNYKGGIFTGQPTTTPTKLICQNTNGRAINILMNKDIQGRSPPYVAEPHRDDKLRKAFTGAFYETINILKATLKQSINHPKTKTAKDNT